MEGLMHFCRNWGDADCHRDVSDLRYAKERKESEEIQILPVGEDLRKLDEICEDCKSASFFNEEEKCPVCDSTEVENTGVSGDFPGQVKEYKYKCSNENCGRYFCISEVDLRS